MHITTLQRFSRFCPNGTSSNSLDQSCLQNSTWLNSKNTQKLLQTHHNTVALKLLRSGNYEQNSAHVWSIKKRYIMAFCWFYFNKNSMKNIFSIQTFKQICNKNEIKWNRIRKKKTIPSYIHNCTNIHTFQQLHADNTSTLLFLSFTLSSFELVVDESSLHLGFLSLEFRLCEEKQHSDHTHKKK